MPAASLRALLTDAIDYAGLFPPANLPLDPALRNQAEYIRSADAWMLGAFILPFGKFEESSGSLRGFDVENPLRLSALGPKTENASQFLAALAHGAEAIRAFHKRHGATAVVSQLEIALPEQPGVSLTELAEVLAGLDLTIFLEAPADEAERVIVMLAENNGKASAPRLGFKLRTGGVIASAFPSSVQIARALVSTVAHRVAIKFTAGLHHPIRRFDASVQTTMHGFLNVLGAGVLAAAHGWDVQQTAAMLEDDDAISFRADDDSFFWREWSLSTEEIKAKRALVTSLGSCSFDEPREDLRALNLLP